MLILTKEQIAPFFSQVEIAIGQTPELIYPLFPDASFHFIYLDTAKKEPVLEITTDSFTLSCMIDETNRCKTALVFMNEPDELETVKQLIAYCNHTFPYSYLFNMWIMNDLSVTIQQMNKYLLFSITQLKNLSAHHIQCLTSEGFILPPG